MVQSMENNKKQKHSEYKFPFKWGKYNAIKLIGKGGMGEIFLAEDPFCERIVALKRIQKTMLSNLTLRKRFLNEARIAAQLTHPSIIPIYELIEEDETIYYSMPYLEGQTLREIIINTRLSIEYKRPPYPRGSSIQTLMLIFINLCNAIEYTHSKGFLHRDIKPANIILGEFNNLMILDWGVATKIEDVKKIEEEEEKKLKSFENTTSELGGLTKPGRAVGTVEFLAPERVLGVSSSVLTDIYSLGCTLYLMLTLQTPFDRPKNIKEWRKIIKEKGPDKLIDPQEIAPHREITPQLTRIIMKCLAPDPTKRYQSVQEIIEDVQKYIQGKPEWIPISDFRVDKGTDWEFQEHVLLTKHMAISRYTGIMEWAMVMLSKESYSENIQIKTKVKLSKSCIGLGLLMCVPDDSGKKGPENGYLIWIGSKNHPGCKFFRSNVEIINLEKIFLEPEKWYTISMEYQNNTFHFLIDGRETLSYTSHIPISGGHFGLVLRDGDIDIDPLILLRGSQNVLVNCLSIPDALFMNKYYHQALIEYRRIASSFKGREEGRNAIFRAGLTLIAQAKSAKEHKTTYFKEAIKEFDRLHNTPGDPIGHLGKSIVYQAQNNLIEEIKTLSLALKKFPLHPLIYMLEEHIIFRLHESAETDRIAAYTFTLLTIQYLPKIYKKTEAQSLIQNLIQNWENAPFIKISTDLNEKGTSYTVMSQQIAFWLADPYMFYELTQKISTETKEYFTLYENSFASLIALRYPHVVNYLLTVTFKDRNDLSKLKEIFKKITDNSPIEEKLKNLIQKTSPYILNSMLYSTLNSKNATKLIPILQLSNALDPELIWALLLSGRQNDAKKYLKNKNCSDPHSPYFILQGCYLAAFKGEKEAVAHFSSLIETPLPPTTALLGYFLKGYINLKSGWINQSFFWEKITLYRQLVLYYSCLNNPVKKIEYETRIEEEFKKVRHNLDFIDL